MHITSYYITIFAHVIIHIGLHVISISKNLIYLQYTYFPDGTKRMNIFLAIQSWRFHSACCWAKVQIWKQEVFHSQDERLENSCSEGLDANTHPPRCWYGLGTSSPHISTSQNIKTNMATLQVLTTKRIMAHQLIRSMQFRHLCGPRAIAELLLLTSDSASTWQHLTSPPMPV